MKMGPIDNSGDTMEQIMLEKMFKGVISATLIMPFVFLWCTMNLRGMKP